MKTLKELTYEKDPDDIYNFHYLMWYKDSIEWILKDIEDSGQLTVCSIEKYLKALLK